MCIYVFDLFSTCKHRKLQCNKSVKQKHQTELNLATVSVEGNFNHWEQNTETLVRIRPHADSHWPLAGPLQFPYRANMYVGNAHSMGLHYLLQHLDCPWTCARIFFCFRQCSTLYIQICPIPDSARSSCQCMFVSALTTFSLLMSCVNGVTKTQCVKRSTKFSCLIIQQPLMENWRSETKKQELLFSLTHINE